MPSGNSPSAPARITAQALRALLAQATELAVLDVREEGVYGRDGHLLAAASFPLARLELTAIQRLPAKTVPVVLCDGGDDGDALAHRAARLLLTAGYGDVHVLTGGTHAWRGAGLPLYEGLNTYSKAFAEHLAHSRHTPQISLTQLQAWQAQGRPLRILDCRPQDEFRRMTLPGSSNYPGVEMAYRLADLKRSPDELLIVHCAGRTRSLMAAQTLIEAGMGSGVHALHGGTMGWQLAGLTLEHGRIPDLPPASVSARGQACTAASALARRHGIESITGDGVGALQAAGRTVYLFDVRTREEYRGGHVPGSLAVAGAQLVHALDAWAPVRHAAVVVIDDDGARAACTAMWIRELGLHEVYRMTLDAADVELVPGEPESGPTLGTTSAALPGPALVTAAALARALHGGHAVALDIEDSKTYRAGHIPGAWQAVRSRLPRSLPQLPLPDAATKLVLVSRDGRLAALAHAECASLLRHEVQVLRGGTQAWQADGLPLETREPRFTGPDDDVWLRAHERAKDTEREMADYLQWELGLVAAIASDEGFRYRSLSR